MGRQKQIYDAGQLYSDSMDEFQRYHTYPKGAFIDGAKWADKSMIDKASKWLRNFLKGPMGEGLADSIVDEFRKAMEK